MFDHEIKEFAARVAFCAKIPRLEFTDEEMLLIENAYHYNELPADTAYMIETARHVMSGQPAYIEEDESCE